MGDRSLYWHKGRLYSCEGVPLDTCTWSEAVEALINIDKPTTLLRMEPPCSRN